MGSLYVGVGSCRDGRDVQIEVVCCLHGASGSLVFHVAAFFLTGSEFVLLSC